MGTVDLGDFGVAIGDDEFQAREAEQRRRDEEARRLAAEATRQALQGLQVAPPAAPAAPPAAQVMAEARGEAAPPPVAPRPSAAVRGVPAGPPPDRGFSRVEGGPPAAPAPAAQAPARPSPMFRMPQVDARMLTSAPQPEARAAGPSRAPQPRAQSAEQPAPEEGGSEAGDLARWDRRIQTVQQIYNQERDARRRAVLGSFLMNLVMGASRALAGARQSRPGVGAPISALEARLTQRLNDAQGEWDATDRAVLGALERRDEQGARLQQVQDREGQRELQSRGLALQERRLGMQEASDEERRAAARAELEQAAQQRAQRSDPQSPLSQAYRDTMRQRIETYRATGQAGLADRLEGLFGQRLDSMTAEQLEPLLGRTGGLPQVHTRGRAGGGGGGGGAGVAPGRGGGVAAAYGARLDDAVRNGTVSSEVADGLRADLSSSDRRVRERAVHTVDQMAPPVQMRTIGQGVRVRGDIVDDTMARGMFNSLVGFREQRGSLEALADIGQRYGTAAAISQEAAGELAAPMSRLMAMVANLEGSGIIGPGDLPRIQAALPNPQNLVGMTFGQLDGSLRGFRREIESSVRARLEFAGADAESIENALRFIREGLGGVGAGGQRREQAGGQRVRIVPPTGSGREPFEVDASDPRVERFRSEQGRSAGFRVEEVR